MHKNMAKEEINVDNYNDNDESIEEMVKVELNRFDPRMSDTITYSWDSKLYSKSFL